MTQWDLLAGFGLDLVFGDPRWLPHPVRGIGWLINRSERLWRMSGVSLRLAGDADVPRRCRTHNSGRLDHTALGECVLDLFPARATQPGHGIDRS